MSSGTTSLQARAGIRDWHVTEVQTCALPIEHRNTRMTFDRGSLELMSPGRLHERLRIVLGAIIAAWCREMLKIGRASCRERVWSEVLERGLEPNKGNCIQNGSIVRDRLEELD